VAQDSRKDFDPERVRAAWRRRRALVAFAFLVPFTVTVTLAASLPDVYQSSATVLVERQQVPESFVRSTVLSALDTRLQTMNQEILSRSSLEPLIARFHLYPNVTTTAAVDRMRRDIQVDLRSVRGGGGSGSTVSFAITYRGTDRDTVAQVANAIAAFYIEENLKVRQRQATVPAMFLKAPLDSARERLDEHERRLREFQRLHVGQMPQDLFINLVTLERLESQLRLNRSDRLRAVDRQDSLRDAVAEAESVAGQAPSSAAGAPAGLAVRAPASPHVARLRQALIDVAALLASLQDEEQHLRADLGAYRGRIQSLGQRDEELKELTRNFEGARDLYRTLLSRYDEAQLGASIQRQTGEQFRLLDAAIPAARPSAPRRSLLLLIGLVGSLGVAVAAVALAEYLDVSFHTVEELEAATNARVVATIPWIAGRHDAFRQRWRVGVAAALVLVLAGSVAVVTRVVVSRSDVLLTLLARLRS
jgi:succinoglycan biosynthesis transport protein ExoP